MENSLSQLDGQILIVSFIGIVIGWILRWIISRQGTNQLLEQAEAEVEAKSANIAALKQDLSLRDRTISEQKESLSEISNERADLDDKIQAQATDINDLTAKIDLLDSSQSETGESISILEDTIASLEEKLASAEISQGKLIAEQQQEISSLRSNDQSRADQLQERELMVNQLTSDLQTANEELQKHRLEAASRIASHEKQTAPLREVQDKLAELTQLREKDRGEVSKLRASLAVWQNRATKAEAQLDKSKTVIRELESHQDNSSKPNRSYEKLIALKENEISEQKKLTHAAQSRLITIRDEIISRDSDIAQLKDAMQNQQVQSGRELSSISRKLEEQKMSADKLASELVEKQKNMQEIIDHLSSEKTSVTRQLLDAKLRAEALSEGNRSLLGDITGLEAQARVKQDEINSLVGANENLETRIEKACEEAETFQRNLQHATRELHAKLSANNSLRSEIARQESTKQQLENALQTCETQLQELYPQQPSKDEAPKLLSSKPANVDDLKQINGIGPALEKMLNALGIYHFSQLATLSDSEVAWVDKHIETFKGRIYRDEWVKQAKQLL